MITKAVAGQPLKFRAQDWNQIANVVSDYDNDNYSGPANKHHKFPSSTIVRVKNNSDETCPYGCAIMINDSAISPDGNLSEFQTQCILCGIQPDGEDLVYGVTTEPIMPGCMGNVVISGLAVARITVNDADDTVCTMETDSWYLSTGSGNTRIIWMQDTSGGSGSTEVWAIVLLGAGGPTGTIEAYLVLSNNGVQPGGAGYAVKLNLNGNGTVYSLGSKAVKIQSPKYDFSGYNLSQSYGVGQIVLCNGTTIVGAYVTIAEV
jgi:hypothetical protein